MSNQDLAAKYGSGNRARLINKAIRAELVGGNEALHALDRLRIHGGPALDLVRDIVEAMAAEIRRRYNIPQRGDPGDD
jgi:hypothetical protein